MTINKHFTAGAYEAPVSDVVSYAGESFIAASDNSIGADSWTDGINGWCN